jgi:hypothetical protein
MPSPEIFHVSNDHDPETAPYETYIIRHLSGDDVLQKEIPEDITLCRSKRGTQLVKVPRGYDLSKFIKAYDKEILFNAFDHVITLVDVLLYYKDDAGVEFCF